MPVAGAAFANFVVWFPSTGEMVGCTSCHVVYIMRSDYEGDRLYLLAQGRDFTRKRIFGQALFSALPDVTVNGERSRDCEGPRRGSVSTVSWWEHVGYTADDNTVR